jgi:hypothetical protein
VATWEFDVTEIIKDWKKTEDPLRSTSKNKCTYRGDAPPNDQTLWNIYEMITVNLRTDSW